MDQDNKIKVTGSNTGTKDPDKEFMEWKFRKQKETFQTQNDELVKINRSQKTELSHLRQRNRELTDRVNSLEAQLKESEFKNQQGQQDYAKVKGLYLKSKDECSFLKDSRADGERHYENKLKLLGENHKKNVAKLKTANNLKIQQMKTEYDALKESHEKYVKEITEKWKESEESANREVREKEEHIKGLTKTNEDLLAKIQQIMLDYDKDIKSTRERVRHECESWQVALEGKLQKEKATIEELEQEIVSSNKEIFNLERQKEAQESELSNKDKEIISLKKDKKRYQKLLESEETKCAMLEAKLRSSDEEMESLQQTVQELEDRDKKMKNQVRLAKADLEDAKYTVKIQNAKFLDVEPKMKTLEEKLDVMKYKERDFLASVDGCRAVLNDHKMLKKKVGALIGFYIETNKKREVDRHNEHIQQEAIAMLKDKIDRMQHIMDHQQKEKKQIVTALKNDLKQTMDEKMVLLYHLNELKANNSKK